MYCTVSTKIVLLSSRRKKTLKVYLKFYHLNRLCSNQTEMAPNCRLSSCCEVRIISLDLVYIKVTTAKVVLQYFTKRLVYCLMKHNQILTETCKFFALLFVHWPVEVKGRFPASPTLEVCFTVLMRAGKGGAGW